MFKPVLANVVGLIVVALGAHGFEVTPEQQADIVTGIATAGCLINLWLQRRKPEGK